MYTMLALGSKVAYCYFTISTCPCANSYYISAFQCS
jgi:hypothetical protein